MLLLLLSADDNHTFIISEFCRDIMASKEDKIPLFDESLLNRLDKCNSYFLLKLILLPYMTWLDHSILRYLISASKSKAALKLLDEFDSSIDYTQPMKVYPIPAPSQLIIPLVDSDYTLVATKYSKFAANINLEQLVFIRSLLSELWLITENAIQLVAVHAKHFYLYWMIPKVVVKLIEEQSSLDVIQQQLLEEGIIVTNILPRNIYSANSDTIIPALTAGPFSFLTSCVHDTMMVGCIHVIISIFCTYVGNFCAENV